MTSRTRLLALSLLACATPCARAAVAQAAPTTADFEQALTKYVEKIRSTGIADQKVLFVSVRPGRASAGNYPFRATVTIWKYYTGVKGLNFGETCLAKWIDEDFSLTRNEAFGGWDAHTPLVPTGAQNVCTKNPADGAAAYPLDAQPGHLGGRGGNAATTAPPPPAAKPAAGDGTMSLGSYECWAFGQPRLLMNFTVLGGGKYVDSEKKTGTYRVDPANQHVTFHGGVLDGVLPAGFYAVYHLSQGRPAVSFRNAQGNEAQYCEKP